MVLTSSITCLDVVALVAVSILQVKFWAMLADRHGHWPFRGKYVDCRGSMVSWNLDVFYVTTSNAPLAALHQAFTPFSGHSSDSFNRYFAYFCLASLNFK